MTRDQIQREMLAVSAGLSAWEPGVDATADAIRDDALGVYRSAIAMSAWSPFVAQMIEATSSRVSSRFDSLLSIASPVYAETARRRYTAERAKVPAEIVDDPTAFPSWTLLLLAGGAVILAWRFLR